MSDARKLAEEFVTDLRGTMGERVRSALLFGSAARGEWIEGVSDVNVLTLIDDISAPVLAEAAPAVNRAAVFGVRPLLMEVREWRRATDVFSIELSDMKDAGIPLFGDDAVANVAVQASILRLQAERELREKLLHLHGGMLLAADDPARLGQIFMRALPSFMTFLRTALRLSKIPVPSTDQGVVKAGCELASADPAAFQAVLDARRNGGAFTVSLTDPIADQFNTTAERLAGFIDAIGR